MSHGRADIAIGVIDVGSPKGGKLGWAILAPNADSALGKDLVLAGDRPYRSAIDEPEVFSLLGASLLRTG